MVKRESPITLAREVMWRVWKPYRSNRLLATIRRGSPGVRFRDLPYYRPQLERIDGSAAKTVLGVADMICSGQFPLLGYDAADLGFPPKWNRDFVSGFEWEHLPAARVKPVVRHNGSDVKVPWELSRLQFLPVLAKAHLLGQDAKYRDAAKALLLDWLKRNPVGIGVNWTLAMESALRGMSLCFTLSLLQPLRPDERDLGRAVTRAIWEHLLYTEASLEFSHVIRSNHYLGNIVGLLCMALFLEGPGMKPRRDSYRRRVEHEILRQVREDGGDYEASLGYHVLVLQMFTSAYMLLRSAGYEPSEAFTKRLQAMHKFLAAVADSKGCVPQVGDCDDGRTELLLDDLEQMLSVPAERRNSLRISSLLALSNALFKIGCNTDSSDPAWHGLASQPVPQLRPESERFPASGVAVVRRGEAEVLFFAIPNGIQGRGSHTHNDKLSVVARIGGHELFCDCGTHFYTRDVGVRNLYRSTAMHNTITIDGQEQNTINPEPQFAFCIGNQAEVTRIELQQSGDETSVSASHSGYRRLGVEHLRKVRVSRDAFVVEDELAGSGGHEFELHWHLPSIWRVSDGADGLLVRGPRSVRLVFSTAASITIHHKPVQISRTYGGALERGTQVSIRGTAELPCQLTTKVYWE